MSIVILFYMPRKRFEFSHCFVLVRQFVTQIVYKLLATTVKNEQKLIIQIVSEANGLLCYTMLNKLLY